ncbi:putative reverse transcriptase domain-containing protein [Tanacetum coccineum]
MLGQGQWIYGMLSHRGSEVNDGVNEVPDFSTINAQQLHNLLPTIVAQFLACNPKEYDGEWRCNRVDFRIEKMESVQDISGSKYIQKVKYTCYSLWEMNLHVENLQIPHTSREATIIVESRHVEAGHAAYTDRFHELARFCESELRGLGGNHQNQFVAVNEGQGRRNQGDQTRGRAFMLGAEEARQDPNIVTVSLSFGHIPELEDVVGILGELQDKDPSKIEAVKNWKASRTPSKEEMKNAFQTLKDTLCNAPVLDLPNGPDDFVVYCDTSGLGLGCVLMQRERVNSPNYLAEVKECQLIGFKLVQETTKKILQIKDRLKVAHDRVVRFGKKGKLAPRFFGPFEIIEKVGLVAYKLDLHEELDGVHDTFHMSNLKKCLAYPTLQVPLDEIQVDARLNLVEELVEILEREFKKLKRSRIAIVKVRWNSKCGPEFTWEHEDRMKLKYSHLFSADSN